VLKKHECSGIMSSGEILAGCLDLDTDRSVSIGLGKWLAQPEQDIALQEA
jgi:hypothetical protein